MSPAVLSAGVEVDSAETCFVVGLGQHDADRAVGAFERPGFRRVARRPGRGIVTIRVRPGLGMDIAVFLSHVTPSAVHAASGQVTAAARPRPGGREFVLERASRHHRPSGRRSVEHWRSWRSWLVPRGSADSVCVSKTPVFPPRKSAANLLTAPMTRCRVSRAVKLGVGSWLMRRLRCRSGPGGSPARAD
jgi:hypothetical protein